MEEKRDPMYVNVDGVRVFSAEYANWDGNIQKRKIDRLDSMIRVSLAIHAGEIAAIIFLLLQH